MALQLIPIQASVFQVTLDEREPLSNKLIYFLIEMFTYVLLIFIGLEDTCHVMRNCENGEIFATVLGVVNITSGTNSYYKMQLLEADSGNQWFLSRA
jgi:hypothetical protein